MKKLLWFVFILLTIYMGYQDYLLRSTVVPNYPIVSLEFADKTLGKEMVCAWYDSPFAGSNLLAVARNNTRLDFLYILIYVSLILLYSYLQMQQEKRIFINELLRLNLLLALLAGLFDVVENVVLLYNFRHVTDSGLYISTVIISTAKFTLLGWTILVWIISATSSNNFIKII
jgi:hypothetical protein